MSRRRPSTGREGVGRPLRCAVSAVADAMRARSRDIVPASARALAESALAPGALVPGYGRYELSVLGIGIVGIGHSQTDRAEQPFDLRSDQLSLLDQRLGALVDALAVGFHQPPVVHVGGAHDLRHDPPAGW